MISQPAIGRTSQRDPEFLTTARNHGYRSFLTELHEHWDENPPLQLTGEKWRRPPIGCN
jgi:hypothetical protein